jgi:hypothetical protein
MERSGSVTAPARADVLRYALAIAGYIVLGYVTKQFVAFTWGPIYFVTVLEILPRAYRRVRAEWVAH